MKKEDMNAAELLLEAVVIVLGIAYIAMQLYYGIYYHIVWYRFGCNILAVLLVYGALSLLQVYPEKVHRMPQELFTKTVRKYTIRMLRMEKSVFVASLLVPCIFDVLGIEIKVAASIIVLVLVVIIVVYYETKIIRLCKK